MRYALDWLRCIVVHILILLSSREELFCVAERKQSRHGRASLISFQPLGQHVAIGVDFELPFIRVPVKRYKDKYGNPAAMVNINTASIITTGLLAGGSMIVAHLIRSLGLVRERSIDEIDHDNIESSNRNDTTSKENDEQNKREKRRITSGESNAKQLFDHFKLVYKNDTGERVEATLPNLFARIEDTFLQNEIDIAACVQKSVCTLVRKAGEDVRHGRATSIQKILDGLSSFPWLLDALLPYEELRKAIEVGRGKNDAGVRNCAHRYINCKWHAPAEKLTDLLQTYMHFS